MRKVISLLLAIVMTAAVFAVAASAVLGDVNADGVINNKDVVALFKYASGNEGATKPLVTTTATVRSTTRTS